MNFKAFLLLIIATQFTSCIVSPESFTEALNIISVESSALNTVAISKQGNSTTNLTIDITFKVEGDTNQNAKYDLYLCKHADCNIIDEDGLGEKFKKLGPFPAGENTIHINAKDFSYAGIETIYKNMPYRALIEVVDPDGEHGNKSIIYDEIKTQNEITEFVFLNRFEDNLFSVDWDLRDVMLYLDKGGIDLNQNVFNLTIDFYNEAGDIPIESLLLSNIDLEFLMNIDENNKSLPSASAGLNKGFFFLRDIKIPQRLVGQKIRLKVTAQNIDTTRAYSTSFSPAFRVAGSTSKGNVIRTEMRSLMPVEESGTPWSIDSQSILNQGRELSLMVKNGQVWFENVEEIDQDQIDFIGAGDLILYDTNDTRRQANALLVVTGYNKSTNRYSVQSLDKGKNPRNVISTGGTKHFFISKSFISLKALFNATSVPTIPSISQTAVVNYILGSQIYKHYEGELENPLNFIYPQGWLKTNGSKIDLVTEKIDFKVFCYGDSAHIEKPNIQIQIENYITSNRNRIHLITPQGRKYSKLSFRHLGVISDNPSDHFYVYQTEGSNNSIQIRVPNVIIEGIYFKRNANNVYMIAALDDTSEYGLDNIHIRSNLFHSHDPSIGINYIGLNGGSRYFIYFNQFSNTYTNGTGSNQYAVVSSTTLASSDPIMNLYMFNNTSIGLTHTLNLTDSDGQFHKLHYFNNFSFSNDYVDNFDILINEINIRNGEYFASSNYYRKKDITNYVVDNILLNNKNSVELSFIDEELLSDYIVFYDDDFTRNKDTDFLAPGQGTSSIFENIENKTAFQKMNDTSEVYDIKGTKVDFTSLPIGSSY